ncbi:MAG: hypothetical protein KDC61_14715, partial [Saprospiraceae bacterium]|nr:hypothetical protein [Saprospiraceae bacterium]
MTGEELTPYFKIIAAFILSWWIVKMTIKLAPRFYSIRFISAYYTFQFAAIFAFLVVLPDAKVWNRDFPNILLRDYIDKIIIAYLLFQIGVLISTMFGWPLFRIIHKRPPLTEFIKSHSDKLIPPLLFASLIVLTFPFLSYRPGIGYASNILFNFTKFLAFAAGVLFFHSTRLRIFWLTALGILMFSGILTGGRSTAFVSSFLYFLGFYFALTSIRSRRITIIAAITVAIPAVSFLAFMGIFRHIVGRVDFSKIDWERAVSVYRKYEKIKDSKVLDLSTADAQLQGWGRFVNFVNVVQFATMPSKREHLGFDGLFDVDLPYAFDISFLSGTTVEDRLRAKAANFRLNDYGYLVTVSSSVEYSIVTD